jgi:PhnB protein
MDFIPHLSFDGQCSDAFRFYEECFGGKIVTMMTHGDSPAAAQVPAEWHDKVLHARLEIGRQVLMGMDAPPPRYAKPQGIFVTLSVATVSEAERVFNALAEHGRVTMPFQKTFWSAGFGMAVDRFGIPWMINTDTAA